MMDNVTQRAEGAVDTERCLSKTKQSIMIQGDYVGKNGKKRSTAMLYQSSFMEMDVE